MMFSTTALTSLILGVLYVNASALPVTREPSPEPDFQDIEARFGPLAGIAAAGAFGLAKGAWWNRKGKREAEPETQELETRFVGAIAPAAVGLLGSAVGSRLFGNKNRSKREILDDMFSREARDWAQWAESVRNQASKREPWMIPPRYYSP